MKSSILLLALIAVVFSSCTTAYKTGQTPDDVYYSPTRPQEEYVRAEKQDDRYYQGSEDYYTDRYIRMRTMDRYRWSALDDYYFNNPYAYNYYSYAGNWNNPWNSYWTWNNFYNPYSGGLPYYPGNVIIIKNPTRYSVPSRAMVFNPNSYVTPKPASQPRLDLHGPNNRYYNAYNGTNSNTSRYNNTNSSRGNNGSSYRSTNTDNNNYRPNNTSTPTRSYTPSSSSSSSSSGSSSTPSSSSGSSSRPPR